MNTIHPPSLELGRRMIEQRLGARAARVLERLQQERPRYPRLDVLPEDLARVLAACDVRCVYCEAAGDAAVLGIDRLVPARRGGTNHVGNVVAACSSCRHARQGKHLDVFLEGRPHLDARAVYVRIARAAARLRGRSKGDRSAE